MDSFLSVGHHIEYTLKCACKKMWFLIHSALTQHQSNEIEILQKKAFAVILGSEYGIYGNALKLSTQRLKVCTNFAEKCTKHPRHSDLFQPNPRYSLNSRSKKKFIAPKYKTTRYYKSAIPFLTRVLNSKQ